MSLDEEHDVVELTWLQRAELRDGARRLLGLDSASEVERRYAESILALLDHTVKVERRNDELEPRVKVLEAQKDDVAMWAQRRSKVHDEHIADLEERARRMRAEHYAWQRRWIESAHGDNAPLARVWELANSPDTVAIQTDDGVEPTAVVWPHELLTALLEWVD